MLLSPRLDVVDADTTIGFNVDGMFLKHEQTVSDDLLETLKSERLAKAALRAGEMDRVASIPTFVVELWLRQGRDFYNASATEIVSWLERDDLQAFIATPKRV